MANRTNLSKTLRAIPGVKNVYFQPPESLKMQYPCIKYALSRKDVKRANNVAYTIHNAYQLIVIDPNPDSSIPDELLKLPMCSFDRSYSFDGLNHWVFTLYY